MRIHLQNNVIGEVRHSLRQLKYFNMSGDLRSVLWGLLTTFGPILNNWNTFPKLLSKLNNRRELISILLQSGVVLPEEKMNPLPKQCGEARYLDHRFSGWSVG